MRVDFIATPPIPAEEAEGIFCEAMCHAYGAAGVATRLLVPRYRGGDGNHGDRPPRAGQTGYATEHLTPPLGRHFRLFFCLQAAWRARSADLVHSRDVLAAWLSGAVFGRRTILEIHAPPYSSRGPFFSWLLYRVPFRLCLRSSRLLFVLTVTESVATDLRATYGCRKPIVVVPDGVDNRLFVADGAPAAEFSCAYSGSFIEGKGVRELILPLAAALPEVPFHVYGGSAEEQEAMRRQPLPANVVLEGFVPHAELPGRLARHAAFLLPNQRKMMTVGGKHGIGKYTSPMKMFEYMALGRPIIASDLPVLREVLDDTTCLFAAPDSIDAWVRQVRRLAADPRFGETLARTAGARVEAYSWANRVRSILTAVADHP